MKILQLHLKNFRNFKEITFDLHPSFNVVIGENGAGKSTLLSALKVACGVFVSKISDANRKYIEKSDVRLENFKEHVAPQRPVEVIVNKWKWYNDTQITTFKAVLAKDSKQQSSKVEYSKAINQKAIAISSEINDEGKSNVNCPLIAFFGTERLHGAGQKRGTKDSIYQRQILKQGFENWDSMRATSYKYDAWLKGLNTKNDLDNLKWETFKSTIFKGIPDITSLDHRGGELFVRSNFAPENELELPIRQLSDGMQVMLEMIAELAYKAITLNWHHREKAVEETYGMVMIDELEMHLHPNWQKNVAANLMEAFPNIQFVVTSHTPFLVQSLGKENIINLESADLKVSESPVELSIDDVSEKQMGVSQVQRSNFIRQKITLASEFLDIVQKGNNGTLTEQEIIRKEEILIEINQLNLKYSTDDLLVTLLMEKGGQNETRN